jgi:protein TonB
MTNKKSSRANLENKKIIFTLLAFVIALSGVFVALEWSKTEIKNHKIDVTQLIDDELLPIPVTMEPIKIPPPPEKIDAPKELNIVENITETGTVEVNTEFDPDEKSAYKAPPVVEIVEVVEKIVDWADKMPEFPGGQAALFAFLKNNIRYPTIPQELGIQGKVVCQFIVNKDGSIVDVQVVKSVDRYLDEEAVRVINKMPKWTPGFQQDKTVRVKYTLPIHFKLQ